MSATPGYWKNETTGVLAPVIGAYLIGDRLAPAQIPIMRAYLRQWIAADWRGKNIADLRAAVDNIQTHDDVKRWLDDALLEEIDPL